MSVSSDRFLCRPDDYPVSSDDPVSCVYRKNGAQDLCIPCERGGGGREKKQGAGQEPGLPARHSAEEGRICLEEGIEVTHGHCPLLQTRDHQRLVWGEGGMGPNLQQLQALHPAALGLQSHLFQQRQERILRVPSGRRLR